MACRRYCLLPARDEEKRMKRGFAVVIIIILLLLGAAFALYNILLPDFLAGRIIQELEARGLSEISLEVGQVSFTRTVLKNVRIGGRAGLFIREIRADYDRAALARNRVRAVRLYGLEFPVAAANGKIDWGPLANFKSAGPLLLPFDSLAVEAAALRLDWEGLALPLVITAVMKNLHDDSLALDLHAGHAGGALTLQALCSLDSLHGVFDLKLARIDAGLLQQAQRIYFPNLAVAANGRFGGAARIFREGARRRAQFFLDGDSLSVEYHGAPHRIHATRLRIHLALKPDSSSRLQGKGLINGVPVVFNANLDPASMTGSGDFNLGAIHAREWQRIFKTFAGAATPAFAGAIAVRGNYDFDGEKLAAHVLFDGRKFSLRSAVAAHELQAFSQKLEIGADFLVEKDAGPGNRNDASKAAPALLAFEASVQGLQILFDKLGLALDGISARLPVDWRKQEMQNGKLAIARARWHEFELSDLAGDLQWKNQRWNFSASSRFLEGARLDLSGWADYSQEKISGELSARAPAFELRHGAALVKVFPKLREHAISGVFAGEARFEIAGNEFTPALRLEMQNINWQSKLSEARLDGITGALMFDSLNPPATAGEQRLTFASGGFGAFEIADGAAVFTIANPDSVLFKSVSCSWAGGRLSSGNFLLQPSAARIDFVLHAEALDLQAILDFVEYRGVKGQGKIYGELPITLHWGAKKRLSFGDGYLEARPQAGVLQLSPENARALMGMRGEPVPGKASLEEQVNLMVVNALQDMAYTNLRIEFKNEPERGLMTYVRVQGYGPRHDRENQIPIGGFNVNINHLDDLINSMMWAPLGAEKNERN